MGRRVKRFGSYVERGLGSAFLSFSGSAREVVRDDVRAKIRGLTPAHSWREIAGTVAPELPLPFLDEARATDRSHNLSQTSLGHQLDQVPEAMRQIIEFNRSEISSYLGANFRVSPPLIWTNTRIEQHLAGYDVYSNVWHQDSGDGNRLLHVFLLVEEVTESDGPFEYVPVKFAKQVFFDEFKSRYNDHPMGATRKLSHSTKITGKPRDYVIMNPAISPHRAGIPASSRTIANMTLYPEWRIKGVNVDWVSATQDGFGLLNLLTTMN